MSDVSQSVSPVAFFYEKDNTLKVRQAKLVRFLASWGFGKAYVESETKSSLVRVENGIVQRTSKERIQDYVMEEVRSIQEDVVPDGYAKMNLVDVLVRGANVYFGDNLLRSLPRIDLEFNRDTKDDAFFYFRNGFLRVTAGERELRPYEELDGAIWADQIIDREFQLLRDTEALVDSDWFQFLNNVMAGDTDRATALWSALGYLLHGYKDPANTKAIVFLDEAISDVPSGRTGKSLVAEALQKLVPVQRIDARNFRFGGQFSFQSIGIEDQVIDFNDASKDFDFEKLFSLITDDMQVERKYQDEVTIPFEDAPKILISTNHVIDGEGSSFKDRVFQIEYAPHYDEERTPEDDFDQRFFEEWDREQWRCFDNFMTLCVQKYLQDGLQPYRHKNLKRRKLRQKTSPEFAEWILEQEAREYDKKELFSTFKHEKLNGNLRANLTQRQFTRWCNRFGRIYTGEDLPTRKSGRDRFITLPDLEKE